MPVTGGRHENPWMLRVNSESQCLVLKCYRCSRPSSCHLGEFSSALQQNHHPSCTCRLFTFFTQGLGGHTGSQLPSATCGLLLYLNCIWPLGRAITHRLWKIRRGVHLTSHRERVIPAGQTFQVWPVGSRDEQPVTSRSPGLWKEAP